MNSICRSSRRTWCAALALTLSAWGLAAQAQAPYPQRPITFVVPNAAGGAADNLARSFAEALGKQLGQSVVVENLGGASGSLAAQKVLRAAPDGYTLLFGTTSDMVVAPIAIKSVGYSAKDFTPIAKVGSTPMTLVARSNLGVSNAEQLVALAKQKPGGLTVGTTGNASLQAFATVALQRAAKIDLLGVPYKGGAPLMNDLLGGQIDLGVAVLPGIISQVRGGKLTMLGVLSDKRSPLAGDLPTLGETPAFKGVSVEIWAGVAGPAGLPTEVVERLSQAIKTVLEDARYVEQRAKSGDSSVPFAPPAEFGKFLLVEDARYRELATGLKLE
jgi:tripartite-type tricarboxylate transporter receptor subunit TctC